MTYDKTFPVNAQFIDTFYPTIGGVVRTVDNYARIMNKYSYSCVVTPGAAGEYADNFPYDVVRAKSVTMPLREYRLAVPGITDGLENFLDSKPFQLFHAHSPFTMGRYALRQARRLGIPIVASFHSKYYDDIMDLFHSPLVADAAVKEIVKFYENVDAVWACSEGTADTLRGYGYRGGITVMDNGTDYSYPDRPEILKAAAAEKFGIPNGRTVLLFVGHQVWQKNIRMVLDTAAELRDRGFAFTLLMVGSGYSESSIRSYASRLGLEGEFVRFLGKVSDTDTMKGLYLSSDLFFFPSIYDNAPLVVREAAAMGTPSLLVRGSNAAEKVDDGVNGFLTEESSAAAADRIQAVFAASGLAVRAGEQVRLTLCRPWEDILTSVAEKYAEVLS